MSQFFFHVRQDATLFEDKQGRAFKDLRAAWDWALHDAQVLIRQRTLQGPIEEHWIEIHDAEGSNVATLPFVRVTSLH